MLKKLLRNNRALSPIFATLIILSIVTVLFIPVFIWAAGMTSSTQESWALSGSITTERIVIEEVNLTVDSCTIYVRNIGETAITISNVIISSDSAVVKTYQGGQISTSNPINGNLISSVTKGNLIKIQIANLNFVLTADKTYTIQVATARGVSDNYLTVA